MAFLYRIKSGESLGIRIWTSEKFLLHLFVTKFVMDDNMNCRSGGYVIKFYVTTIYSHRIDMPDSPY